MKDYSEFVARPPRHAAYRVEQAELSVRFTEDGVVRQVRGRLEDFSRGGLRFSCESKLELRQHVTIEFAQADGFRECVSGTVRWRSTQNDQIVYGCAFDNHASWEVLGELLLRGVLVREQRPDRRAETERDVDYSSPSPDLSSFTGGAGGAGAGVS